MATTVKEMNREQLREIATGINSECVYDALGFLFFLCGPTIQSQVREKLKIFPAAGLTQSVDSTDAGERAKELARGKEALQLLIEFIPDVELCAAYRYLDYIVFNE